MKILTKGANLGVDKSPLILATKLAPNRFYSPMSKYQSKAVTNWLIDRVTSGGAAGPFDASELPFPFHIVPIFTVPKPELFQYRVIQNFSYKYNEYPSINDHISHKFSILQYVSKPEIAKMMAVVGSDGYAFGTDIKEAFYVIPLNPSEYPLMGFKWGGKLWVFKVLGMGVSSSVIMLMTFLG